MPNWDWLQQMYMRVTRNSAGLPWFANATILPGGAVDVIDRPARQVGVVTQGAQVDVSDRAARALGIAEVEQAAHDDLNANANIQVGDVDAGDANPVPIKEAGSTEELTPDISAAAIYAAGDALGGLLEFPNAARVAGDGGVISNMIIIDDDQEDAEIELWLFDRTFAPTADNALFDPSDADMEHHIGVLSTADGTYYDSVSQGTCTVQGTLRYDLLGTSLFGQMVIRSLSTFTAITDITVKVGMVSD